ncbi:MAG: hypothetical protein H6740_09210 [Alphaproteobacteria bacterium]|nr:hypothetical protein [Alphaproteobacteria bacterium]
MRRELALWALLGLLVHAAWALTLPTPVDWDPLYYRGVAAHILAGDGAVSGALWALGWTPDLPYVADLHWMPLPSRILVPGLAVWAERGDQAVTVLLAAGWAPLAWLLARELGERRDARLAAALALGAGPYARFLSTPDSIALYGLLGGLGFWALSRRRLGGLMLVAALAALTRGEGFLLGLALGLGLGGARGLLVAGAGLASTAAWMGRNLLVAGPVALTLRQRAADAPDYLAFVRGAPAELSPLGHLSLAWAQLPGALLTLGLIGLFLLQWPALLGAWRRRERPWVRAALGYATLAPAVVLVLAPAVGGSGSVFRTSAAVFPALCALAAVGAWEASRAAQAARGYPPLLLPGLLLLGFLVGSGAIGAANARVRPSPPDPCPALAGRPPGEVVFAADPLRVDALCGRPAALLPRGISPEEAAALAARYGVRVALPGDPVWDAEGVSALPDEAEALLPGWRWEGALLTRGD